MPADDREPTAIGRPDEPAEARDPGRIPANAVAGEEPRRVLALHPRGADADGDERREIRAQPGEVAGVVLPERPGERTRKRLRPPPERRVAGVPCEEVGVVTVADDEDRHGRACEHHVRDVREVRRRRAGRGRRGRRATGCRRAAGAGQGRRRLRPRPGPRHDEPARRDHDDRDDREPAPDRPAPAADPRDRDVEALRRSVGHPAAVRPAAIRAPRRRGRRRRSSSSAARARSGSSPARGSRG